MRKPPRITEAVLLIVDISGYTRFVQQRPVSLEHAEAIVTELMESIIDRAGSPLVVNKLEGDAALLYLETHGARREAIHDALAQVATFFEVFAVSLQRISNARSHCNCEACANIESLQLKAFLDVGDIVVKQVRQFEEIAGEVVIRVHRMTKNSLPSHEYVLMTEAVVAAGHDVVPRVSPLTEILDGEAVALHWCTVDALEVPRAVRDIPAAKAGVQRSRKFANLPSAAEPARRASWWSRLRTGLFGPA